MRKWSGEQLCSFSEYLTVKVRPNLDWLPVDMHWRNKGGDGEEDVFEGSDILGDNDWIYQIAPEVMLEMLTGGATGRGTVIKYCLPWMPLYIFMRDRTSPLCTSCLNYHCV
jgi:hypothetical protein